MSEIRFIDVANAPERLGEDLYREFNETRDRALMAQLFRKHMSLVFGVCMKYLAEKSAAQDATMEIFERLLTHQSNSVIKNFKAYLYVMTKNYCLMKQRGEKVIWIEISDSDVESTQELHPLDEGARKEKALVNCMKQLNDDQKACIDLFYWQSRSYGEISKELKVTLNSVKSHIQNGKRNLKNCLDKAA